jgi:hypothetical protein
LWLVERLFLLFSPTTKTKGASEPSLARSLAYIPAFLDAAGRSLSGWLVVVVGALLLGWLGGCFMCTESQRDLKNGNVDRMDMDGNWMVEEKRNERMDEVTTTTSNGMEG